MSEQREELNNAENEVRPDFGKEINTFISHIESLADIYPLIMQLISTKLVQEFKHTEDFITQNNITEEDITNNGGKQLLLIPEEKLKGFLDISNKLSTTRIANKFLPINYVVSFVSQFDAYLGGIIRTMFLIQPKLLNSSEKNIQFSELLNFSSLDEAKEFIIEKEVESVLRESHLKQFRWLESKLGITLTKDLSSFKDFIEITERRNLFAHGNGVVSRHYLQICKEHNVEYIKDLKIGDKLYATPQYIIHCYAVLFEIGVKLGQVIWRKLQPDKLEEADKVLNNVSYQLLVRGNYKLALNLLMFATETLKKHHDQEIVCIFMINKALAHYLAGKKENCNKSLDTFDWSASSEKFKLAVEILKENYSTAITLMKAIGPSNSHLTKSSYREWPLFNSFRKTDEFKQVYQEIFGEEFIYVEEKPTKLIDILKELNKVESNGETTFNNYTND